MYIAYIYRMGYREFDEKVPYFNTMFHYAEHCSRDAQVSSFYFFNVPFSWQIKLKIGRYFFLINN